MKKCNAFAALFLVVLLSAGSSGCGSGGSQDSAAPPSAPPPVERAPAPPLQGSSIPAGATVVYSENGSVNAIGTNGQERATLVGNATYQGATEDGWVILARDEELISVRVADGTLRVLDDTSGSKQFRGVFDTNRVVYELQAGDNSSLHVVRADGAGRSAPVPPQARGLEFKAVTPSGRVLYEACDLAIENDSPDCINRRLLSAALDGSGERLVLEGTPLIRHITADDLLIYERTDETGTAVRAVRSDGSDDVALSEPDSFFAGVLPNGRIAYNRLENGQLDLHTVAADGTSRRALATSGEDEVYAGAVPSGRVLVLRGEPQQRRLYSVDETTGDIRILQEAGNNNVTAIAPDGTVIVSARFGPLGQEQDNLYSVRADGSQLRALADSSDMEWFEAVAPDGRVIYMRCMPAPSGPCGDPSAQSDLYSVNQNATGTVELAASGAFEVAEAVTADNLVIYRLMAAEQSDLYSVPTTGGRAQPLANTGGDERFLTIIEPATNGENPG